jgi:transcriptional regulator with XRE-family HTH domain
VYFRDLQGRIIDIARERVQAGKLTERGLARLCGVSQPHMHNVLKNIRSLSTEAADRLMRALDISFSDLLWRISTETETGVGDIPMIQNRIGPGTDAVFTVISGHIPLPRWLLKDLVDPLAARLGPDLVLPRALAAHDLVLLDQNPQLRAVPGSNGIWVVTEDAGLRIRYLRMGDARICVANEVTLEDPRQWHSIPPPGQNILDIVRARIVWMGREMEKEPAGPADQAC